MDLAPDQTVSRRTTAVTIGVLPEKALLVAFLGAGSLLVRLAAAESMTAIFLAAGAGFFAMDAIFTLENTPVFPWQMGLFILGWNASALRSMPWI